MTSKLTIKATTLINGRDCDFLATDTIITLIEVEAARLDRLEKLAIPSKAIKSLCEYHVSNTKKLLKILDARDLKTLTD